MRLPKNPDVLIMGHPLLFLQQPATEKSIISTENFQHNLNVLSLSQLKANGIGIAAPQIGWKARVMSIGISHENQQRYPKAVLIPQEFWINPTITEQSSDTCWTWEGCLSVPGIRGWVERPACITATGYNQQGESVTKELTGFHARIFQHEMDHLNGLLFTMRINDPTMIIPEQALQNKQQWKNNWPTEGAYKTSPGQLSEQK
ncbi:Peptide deformylase [invertebrate metagenome]|uniref:Peptide deformylase n=1 Tax=invertebrate metagenome TaxID=1711999 RepID=A0A2H9T9W5_9ZZZZ